MNGLKALEQFTYIDKQVQKVQHHLMIWRWKKYGFEGSVKVNLLKANLTWKSIGLSCQEIPS